jgi:hypothetical protein
VYRDQGVSLADGKRRRQIVGWDARRLCFIVITLFYACAASRGSPTQTAVAPGQPQGHIYVTSSGLNGDCYEDLGQVAVTESFAQSVVEADDSQAQRLRELAREKYSSNVDAIINVHQQQNDAGTAVKITGEAVHLRNHETVACVARDMPGVVDSAAAASAGGIVGTVVGGLAVNGGSVYGAEAGGAMGASAAAGIEMAKHRQQQQAEEAFIGDRLQQQQNEIERLDEQLSQLIQQQCNNEELSAQDCDQRVAAVQQEIAKTNEAAQELSSPAAASASKAAPTDFQVRNRIQEQQEIIDQLELRIAQMKRSNNDQ